MSNDSPTRPTRSSRLPGSERNIPAGWPRPHYLGVNYTDEDDTPAPKRVLYAQWIAYSMEAQITSCDTDKTAMAGTYHLCSNCGTQMERGLLLNWEWVNAQRPTDYVAPLDSDGNVALSHGQLDRFDSGYGSSFCYRCAVFALKHCPYFSGLNATFGGDLRWYVTFQASDLEEFDDTSAVRPTHPDTCLQVTTADVRNDLAAGHLHLGTRSADDLPVVKRVERFNDLGHAVFYPEQVAKLTPDEVEAQPRPATVPSGCPAHRS